MNDTQYSIYLLMYYITLDTTNAKYLWKRIPKALKDPKTNEGKNLAHIWEIGKALFKNEFEVVFELIEQPKNKPPESLNPIILPLK